MRDPIGALEFFCDKTAVQWLEPTYGSFLFTSNMTTSSKWMKAFYSDRGYQIFYEIMNQLQNVIYIGVLFYYIYVNQNKIMLIERNACIKCPLLVSVLIKLAFVQRRLLKAFIMQKVLANALPFVYNNRAVSKADGVIAQLVRALR